MLDGVRWIALLFLTLGLSGCKSVHVERWVPASSSEIWSVLMDGSGYGAWNPVLVEADGAFREGGTMAYRMMTPDGTTTPVEAEIRRLEPGVELNQSGGLPGILTFDHHWILESVEGGTRVIQHEDYAGVGVLFWDPGWYEEAYARGLEALEARVAERRAERAR